MMLYPQFKEIGYSALPATRSSALPLLEPLLSLDSEELAQRFLLRLTGLGMVLLLVFGSTAVLAADETGTTIIGTQEAPTVLNLVPWQGPELSADPQPLQDKDAGSALEQSLAPTDRELLLREVQYFNLLLLEKK